MRNYRLLLSLFICFAALSAGWADESAVSPPPAAQPTTENPMKNNTSDIVLDTANNMVGIAQNTAHDKGLQGRIMWIDAGANIGSLNTPEKIRDTVTQIKKSGFNMVVLDVKPIVGDTLYPSKCAPKLTEWKGKTAPKDLDILQHMLDEGHLQNLTVYANISTFGEGHKVVNRGLAYKKPDWQTVLYKSKRAISIHGATMPIAWINVLPANDSGIAAITKPSLFSTIKPGSTVVILNFDARVMDIIDSAQLSGAAAPLNGFILVGNGKAGEWLRQFIIRDEILRLIEEPDYIRVQDDPEQTYTMFCNPYNPEVRAHELDIVKEIVTNYGVDGVVFDDRLRYAGPNADFSELSRKGFESYLGHAIKWPDDVYRASLFPGQSNVKGPYYHEWLLWRAETITSWVKEASHLVKSIRPSVQVSIYCGSWYGSYYQYGSNWAGPDFESPWPWATPDYRATGYADHLDWITTGCYYRTPTIAQAQKSNISPGISVEGAGQLSNRVVNDSAWTYAGIYALVFSKRPDLFQQALRAAMGSSQGVMIFDMSQIIEYNWWDKIAAVFGSETPASPNTVPGLLEEVRQKHRADKAAGVPQPPIPAYQGIEATGF